MGVDEHGLPVGLPYTPQQIRDGFGLFFDNKQIQAEKFFAEYKDSIPVFSLGYSTMAVVRAIMSFETGDIQNAIKALGETEGLAYAATAQESTFASLTRFVLRTKKETMTSEQVHNTVMTAECRLMTGILQFFQESVMGFIKGGMNIRSAWKVYEKMWSIYCAKEIPLDTETRGAVQFGVGTFNLVNSILPAKMLKLVSILGFPSSRDVAVRELNNAHNGGGVRAPVAACILLVYHVVLQSFFGFDSSDHIKEAERILAINLGKYPDGGLFLFISGRLNRLKRNIVDSIRDFERAVEAQKDWKQLQHLCFYELGWCHFFNFDWVESEKYFGRLCKENEWSKGFYAYMQGLCYYEQGQLEQATKYFLQVPELMKRRFGGKQISVEQYVGRKVKQYVTADAITLILPSLEMTYLWNGFAQMPEVNVRKNLTILESWVNDAANATQLENPEVLALTRLLRAALVKELGPSYYEEVKELLNKVEAAKKEIVNENWIIPHARYEYATMLLMSKNHDKEARNKLVKAQKYNVDYNFEMRLRLKMHLTWDHLKGMTEVEDDEAVDEDDDE